MGRNAVGAKTCSRCRTVKTLAEFYRRRASSDGRGSTCKPCQKAVSRQQRWNWNGVEMTVPRYEAMRREQNNRCAICRRPPGKRDLHVDHDHDTNVIRGLLCYYCNTGLGNFKDDIALLEKACDYLRKHAGNGKASA